MIDFLIKHKSINPLSAWVPKSKIMPNKCVMVFFEEITKWVDDGSPVDVIYLDFKKEFDKYPDQRPILNWYGNSIINWIEQWLIDRRQMVVVGGEVSSWKSVLRGCQTIYTRDYFICAIHQ